MMRFAIAFALALAAVAPCGARIPAADAVRRADAWLARGRSGARRTPGILRAARGGAARMRPAGAPTGTVRTFADGDGAELFHFVALSGGGYVTVAADENAPLAVVGFSDSDDLPEPGDGGPLWTILRAASQRAAYASHPPVETEKGIDDLRVAPLVQSKWDQSSVSGRKCYNYYTPNNWYCGCVATAMAQLMRFHGFPSGAVSAQTFTCYTNVYPVALTMKGGTYAWDSMPLAPSGAATEAQRQAIGKICYDAGVSVRMQYEADGSGAYGFGIPSALRDVFGFANAQACGSITLGDGTVDEMAADDAVRRGILPNLDAGCPVFVGLSGSQGGHSVLADGYGFADGVLYCHLNMGWSGAYNYWYALPEVEGGGYWFDSLDDIVYNVFPDKTGEIASGRVTDAAGNPVAGATVSGIAVYRVRNKNRYVYTTNTVSAVTSDRGVYAVIAPAGVASTVTLSAAFGDWKSTTVETATAASSSPLDFDFETGGFAIASGGLSIGNSWGNDIVVTPPSRTVLTIR